MLVDVGANEGDFVNAVAALGNLAAVYAVEPQPSCAEQLREVLQQVQAGTLITKALGDREGMVQFHVTRDSKLASVLTPDSKVAAGYTKGAFDVAKLIEVAIVTLDQELKDVDSVGLLKPDVQGLEIEVLRGAEEILKRTSAVLMEVNYMSHYHGGANFDDVYMLLKNLGFQLSGVSEPYGSGTNGPLSADAMFLRNELVCTDD